MKGKYEECLRLSQQFNQDEAGMIHEINPKLGTKIADEVRELLIQKYGNQ